MNHLLRINVFAELGFRAQLSVRDRGFTHALVVLMLIVCNLDDVLLAYERRDRGHQHQAVFHLLIQAILVGP